MGDEATDRPSIAQLVSARTGDEHIGLRFEGESWTWGEVVQESAARASMLASLRVDGPFHIGVLLDNVPEYVFLLGGAALAGATIVGINPTRRGAELARDIAHTDCQVLITEPAHIGLLDGLDLGLADGRVLVADGDRYQAMVADHRGAPRPDPLPSPDTTWVLIFTSGSTGAPKAVKASQGRAAAYGSLGFGPDDVLYCAMPLFHGNALTANLVPALAAGATVVLRRRFSASGFLDDVRREGVTYFNTVGRAIAYILETPPTAHDRDHRVKVVLGPETSSADAAAFHERFGIPVIEGYGSSEGVIRMIPVPSARAGSLGRPDRGADVAVVDPDTLGECPAAVFDETGRLVNAAEAIGEIVRRDGVSGFEGYYNNDEANAARTRNGWFWSGDLGYRDDDGIFYFAGRDLDWIRVDGENFAAAPVERILARHPDVTGVAVVGVADPVTGDQVLAVLEQRAGTSFDPAGFADFLAEQDDLGTKWAPRFVRVVDHLPVTGTNKIDKKPLRAAAWRSEAADVWWRPGRELRFESLTAVARAQLESAFIANDRAHLLPIG